MSRLSQRMYSNAACLSGKGKLQAVTFFLAKCAFKIECAYHKHFGRQNTTASKCITLSSVRNKQIVCGLNLNRRCATSQHVTATGSFSWDPAVHSKSDVISKLLRLSAGILRG